VRKRLKLKIIRIEEMAKGAKVSGRRNANSSISRM